MEKLITFMQEMAKAFLRENKEFAPFGAFIKSNGNITSMAAYTESISSEEIYNMLLKEVEDNLQNEDIRAWSIALDGKINDEDVLVIEVFLSKEDKYQAVYPYIIQDEIVVLGSKI